ncbi:MAG TPA: nicotinate phosphoribosyltransferase, partial [Isosphaeraceae bacterium]|nr:nicotinate phosphoribosyltransferase [Isosphaeraceae bacterium]
RLRDVQGRFACDRVTIADETSEGEPLLVPVIRGGRLVAPLPKLDAIREHCRAQGADLPDALRGPEAVSRYPTAYSFALEHEAEKLGAR